MARTAPARATTLLVILFVVGLGVIVLAFIDLRWTHWVLVNTPRTPRKTSSVDPQELQRLDRHSNRLRETFEYGGGSIGYAPSIRAFEISSARGPDRSCDDRA